MNYVDGLKRRYNIKKCIKIHFVILVFKF